MQVDQVDARIVIAILTFVGGTGFGFLGGYLALRRTVDKIEDHLEKLANKEQVKKLEGQLGLLARQEQMTSVENRLENLADKEQVAGLAVQINDLAGKEQITRLDGELKELRRRVDDLLGPNSPAATPAQVAAIVSEQMDAILKLLESRRKEKETGLGAGGIG